MSAKIPVWIGLEFIYKKVSKWTEETPTTMGKYLTWVTLTQVNFSSAVSAKGKHQDFEAIMLCPNLSCHSSASVQECLRPPPPLQTNE